jgi:hypothetical protein
MADEQRKPTVIDRLRELVERGQRFAAQPSMARGHVRVWTSSVRNALRDIFGETSPTFLAWPTQDTVPEVHFREMLLEWLGRLESLLESVTSSAERAVSASGGNRIFVGHGRSPVWLELRHFLENRLSLKCEEFNSESTAGVGTTERLTEMLAKSGFAFLIMTGEDEHADAKLHARENVVHEVGLFQGRLGMKRAIILKEEGCQVFSNIHGLTYIGFPKGNIKGAFEEIRMVLEREHIIKV